MAIPCCSEPAFWIYVLVIVALVVFAGLMSGLTLGLMSLSVLDLEVLAKSGSPKDKAHAAKILPLVRRQHLLLCTLLLGNALAMEALPIFLDELVPSWGAILISVTLILMFGEILPQAVCSRYGLAVGATLAPLVRLLVLVAYPVAYPISKLLDLLLGKDHAVVFRRQQLQAFVTMHSETAGKGGVLTDDETTIIAGALELAGKTAEDAMTPLADTFALSIDTKLDGETLHGIIRKGHSRVPVFSGPTKSNIVGVVLVKSLLTARPEDETLITQVPIRSIPRVPASMPLYDILNEFQKGHSHMAVVVRGRGSGTTQLESSQQGTGAHTSGGPADARPTVLRGPLEQQSPARGVASLGGGSLGGGSLGGGSLGGASLGGAQRGECPSEMMALVEARKGGAPLARSGRKSFTGGGPKGRGGLSTRDSNCTPGSSPLPLPLLPKVAVRSGPPLKRASPRPPLCPIHQGQQTQDPKTVRVSCLGPSPADEAVGVGGKGLGSNSSQQTPEASASPSLSGRRNPLFAGLSPFRSNGQGSIPWAAGEAKEEGAGEEMPLVRCSSIECGSPSSLGSRRMSESDAHPRLPGFGAEASTTYSVSSGTSTGGCPTALLARTNSEGSVTSRHAGHLMIGPAEAEWDARGGGGGSSAGGGPHCSCAGARSRGKRSTRPMFSTGLGFLPPGAPGVVGKCDVVLDVSLLERQALGPAAASGTGAGAGAGGGGGAGAEGLEYAEWSASRSAEDEGRGPKEWVFGSREGEEVIGIITMEDVIEELLQEEIYDESDLAADARMKGTSFS